MTHTEIDRMLVAEERVTPSPGFASSVMQAVRAVHSHAPVVPFPWRRLGMGVAASAALAVLTVGGLALTSVDTGLGFDASMVAARLNIIGTVQFAVVGTATIVTLASTRLLFEFVAE